MSDANPSTQTATFGAGCFWNSQRAFAEISGVLDTVVGFMDEIEVVQVVYDPKLVSYEQLLVAFLGNHDTSVGSGGERSAIFVDDEQLQRQVAKAMTAKATQVKGKISTQIRVSSEFERAPERDQNYLDKRDG